MNNDEENERLDELEERLNAFQRELDGSRSQGTIGLIAEIRELTNRMNMFDRLWAPDALGNGGIRNRLEALETWKRDAQTDTEYKRKYWRTLMITIITTLGLLLTNLDRIADGVKKFAPNSPVFDQPKKKKVAKKRKVVKPCNPDLEECPETNQP